MIAVHVYAACPQHKHVIKNLYSTSNTVSQIYRVQNGFLKNNLLLSTVMGRLIQFSFGDTQILCEIVGEIKL